MNICRTFSMDNKKQQQNLIETLNKLQKNSKRKTGKTLQILLQGFNGITGSIIVYVMIWDNIFFSFTNRIQSNVWNRKN